MTDRVETRVCPQPPAMVVPGFRVRLDGGVLVTVRWDEVVGHKPVPST